MKRYVYTNTNDNSNNECTRDDLLNKIQKIINLDQKKVTPKERKVVLKIVQELDENSKNLRGKKSNLYYKMLDKIERSAKSR